MQVIAMLQSLTMHLHIVQCPCITCVEFIVVLNSYIRDLEIVLDVTMGVAIYATRGAIMCKLENIFACLKFLCGITPRFSEKIFKILL